MSETHFEVPLAKVKVDGKLHTLRIAKADIEAAMNNHPMLMEDLIEVALEVIVNRRMTSVGSVTKMTGAELEGAQSKAITIAEENLTKLLDTGDVGKKKAKAKVAKKEVLDEARRIARNLVRDNIRKIGKNPSRVEAKKITELANALIETNPSILEEASANIEARKSKVSQESADAIALLEKLGGVAESPRLIAKDEEKKAKAKATRSKSGTLSATQASKPAKHGQGKVPPAKPQAPAHQGAMH